MDECEIKAEVARRESKVCKTYKCVEHSHGITIDGME